MEAPPKFLEGLEKYFSGNLKGAKGDLTGDDVFSKALLVLVDVKLDDGSKNDEIQARIDGMDFKGNDIALMFCVLAQEYGLHMTKAHNLLLKRFGKEEKVIGTEPKEEEMPELEPVKGPEANEPDTNEPKKPEANEPKGPEANEPKGPEANEPKANEPKGPEANEPKKPETNEPKANEPKKPEANEPKKPENNEPKAPEANAAKKPNLPKQSGGKRLTRKASSSEKKQKRVSRGKA